MISLSSAFGLISGFKGSLLQVYFSLLVFVAGYKVAQIGLHHGSDSKDIFSRYISRIKDFTGRNMFSFAIGSVFMALGFNNLTKSIIYLDSILAGVAAVTMGSGYMIVHWSINNTLV
jgi:hypothetical protein